MRTDVLPQKKGYERMFCRKKVNFVFEGNAKYISFAALTVVVAQLVRALDCGSRGRGFEPHHPPEDSRLREISLLSRLLYFKNPKL